MKYYTCESRRVVILYRGQGVKELREESVVYL